MKCSETCRDSFLYGDNERIASYALNLERILHNSAISVIQPRQWEGFIVKETVHEPAAWQLYEGLMFVQILPNDLQHVVDSAFPCFRIISCLGCVKVMPFFPICIVAFYLLILQNRYVGELVLVNCTAVYNIQDLTLTFCTTSFVC